MVTATRTEQKMVTGTINGQEVTVPAGTVILEAARMAGIEIPNLCFQPLLRAWGSCRICTVEILGKRGGLIESCATPLTDGMEVLTHSPEVMQARQFILQMYLIDHALDCPTCDKSGECYLQDNTYLHNIHANPYRRPKFAQPYTHFSELIDYKWDRCIMCNRCTRVCDEVIGVTAIEGAYRSLEATIAPAYGADLTETLCTSCGMCIAVCPVGALTDRHFGHHPWELDTTETICGFCDVGCTLNVEANRGLVRRVTNLWERGTNHGYLCERGKWGHEQVQHQDRLFYPTIRRAALGREAVHSRDRPGTKPSSCVAESLAHYQGDQFAALVSPDATNEEAYVAQVFTRAVMASPHVDRYLGPAQAAVARATSDGLGVDVSNTNNMQELFSDVKAGLVVGPNIGKAAPVASYWFYHSQLYREAKYVVISHDDYPLGWRSPIYLKPNPGTTAVLLNGIARAIVEDGLARAEAERDPGLAAWRASLGAYDLERVAAITGITGRLIRDAAMLYATGGAGPSGRCGVPGFADLPNGRPQRVARIRLTTIMATRPRSRRPASTWPSSPATSVARVAASPVRAARRTTRVSPTWAPIRSSLPGGFDVAGRRSAAPVRSRLDAALGRPRHDRQRICARSPSAQHGRFEPRSVARRRSRLGA